MGINLAPERLQLIKNSLALMKMPSDDFESERKKPIGNNAQSESLKKPKYFVHFCRRSFRSTEGMFFLIVVIRTS